MPGRALFPLWSAVLWLAAKCSLFGLNQKIRFAHLVGNLQGIVVNPFTAEVAITRLLGSAPLSHLCDQKRRSKVTGLFDLMTLCIDLGYLYCKQTQRAFNVFKNTLNWLKIDSVDQKFNWLECGNFSQDSGMSGTEGVIAFSQLAVKGLKWIIARAFVILSGYWH
jgi:hypothetical protein